MVARFVRKKLLEKASAKIEKRRGRGFESRRVHHLKPKVYFMNFKQNKISIVLILALFMLSILIILTIYNKVGLGWDFTDIYLTGKSLVTPAFYQQSLPLNNTYIVSYNGNLYRYGSYFFITPSHIYLSLVREPLVPVFLALFLLISHAYAMQIYFIFLLILLILSSFYVSKKLGINPLILVSLLLAPYLLQWTVLYTSQEMLSIVFALIAIGLLAKKSPFVGIALALVGLTKYPGLILFPLILLLFERNNVKKSIIKLFEAVAFFFVTTLPWLLFNFMYFSNPLLSYELSLSEALSNNGAVSIFNIFNALDQFPAILTYPLLIIAGCLIIKLIRVNVKNRKNAVLNKMTNSFTTEHLENRTTKSGAISRIFLLDYKYKIILSFIFLSSIGFILVYNNVGAPERFGYLLYASVALLSTLMLKSITNEFSAIGKFIPYFISGLSIISLIFMYFFSLPAIEQTIINFEGSVNNATILNAVAYLNHTNLAGCSVVSNAQPFLNYYNITAYDSATLCSLAESHYPIVLFKDIGPAIYCNYPINSNAIPSSGYVIAVPANYICQRS